jgi:hypothetical protein
MNKMIIFMGSITTFFILICGTDFVEGHNKCVIEKTQTKEPFWIPPHLEPNITVFPIEIWLGNNTTVNLTVNAVGEPYNGSHLAGRPLLGEPMITYTLSPNISYSGSWTPSQKNNMTIKNFDYIQNKSGVWEARWDVPSMFLGDIFQVQFNISSVLLGWQNIGVLSVKYENYHYNVTHNPVDIWTNKTDNVFIFVKDPNVPDLPIIIVPAITAMAIFYIIRRKR